MKRLFALIIGFFVSMFNNVDYMVNDMQQFVPNSYYTIDVADPPDYREYYGATPSASNKLSCKTGNYSAGGKQISSVSSGVVKGYWLENMKLMRESAIPNVKEFTFESETLIIAPYDCTLETESVTNQGNTMTVICSISGKNYRLVFDNMVCWYCDVSRNNLEETSGYHTGDEQKGKKFKAGNVLGKAANGTTVVVSYIPENGDAQACTLLDMYKQIIPSQ